MVYRGGAGYSAEFMGESSFYMTIISLFNQKTVNKSKAFALPHKYCRVSRCTYGLELYYLKKVKKNETQDNKISLPVLCVFPGKFTLANNIVQFGLIAKELG